ncbi:MAG: MoxR family ATPase [Planctomycetota bacterium]|nr:MoxR family ATPase [Planctomycetota bacterium]MDA1105397.1 MoxR family ATPase [Planctomycetota bacterium]
MAEASHRLKAQLQRVIVGQNEVLDELMVAMFTGGHALLEGVPGLAKTLIVSTMAKSVSLKFARIQFTPDLMPSDVTGTEVIQEDRTTGHRELRFVRGPIFANVVLADEINRTPPKTQAALLEAMQEGQVTSGGEAHPLPKPFFVLATQNPIEQEGTYPLPEAQLDRFMFLIRIGYPTESEEMEIVQRTTGSIHQEPEAILKDADILAIQRLVREVPIADHLVRYALRLVRATRRDPGSPKIVQDYLTWGAGPRASQFLVLAAKARALLAGERHVMPHHLQAVALSVLRHRIITNFNAQADGITADDIVRELLKLVPMDASDPATARTLDGVSGGA